jgi:hypothetical protein
MPVLDAYQTIIGGIRDFAHGMNGTQDGDPYEAAGAIDLALVAETTPLRLQLGADAVSSVRAHAEHLLKESAAWEKVGLDTQIDAVAIKCFSV